MKSILIIYGINVFTFVLTSHFDLRFPIVIHDQGKSNNPNYNMFGYSLAFLKGYLSDTKSSSLPDGRHTLFIGAPNETQYTQNSGVVWSCELNENGESPVNCSILAQISEKTSARKFDCRKDEYWEKTENQTQQWIGANLDVNSLSRELLVCAPRWKIYDSKKCEGEATMPGACCLVSRTNTTLLNPLRYKELHYNESGTNGKTKFLYRYSEFGLSAHISDSGKLLVGSVGTRSWTGETIQMDQLIEGSAPLTIYNNFSDIGENSYLGYAVTSGRTSSGGQYFASGAPRARRLYGAVTISHPKSSTVPSIFQGEQLGSYFGYALATLDLNRDGYDELLVGAPFYTPVVKSGQKSVMGSFNTGCIFIFNLAQSTTTPIESKICMEPQQLSSRSHFGSAIAKIGDINYDFYDDFAVSAPYDNEKHGTVFIYHGGFPLSNQPAQMVHGKSFSIPGLHGFGNYLLSGNEVDIDGNTSPDLIVGAFESRYVIVLRSRLVAKMSMTISFHSSESTGPAGEISKYSPSQPNIRVMSCISLNVSTSFSSEQKLETWLNFELGSTLPQVQFENSEDQVEHSYQLQFPGETCIEKKLVLKATDTSSAEDSIRLIEFRFRLKYNQTENLSGSHANIIVPTFTTDHQRQYFTSYKSFNPYYPITLPPTYSEWAQLPLAMDNCDINGNSICEPDLKLRSNIFYKTLPTSHNHNNKLTIIGSKPLVIGQLEELAVHIKVLNDKETAYEPTVWVTLGVSENFNMNATKLTLNWEIEGKLARCENFNGTTPNPIKGTTLTSFGHTCSLVIQPGKELTFILKIGNWGHLRVSNGDHGSMTLRVEVFPKNNRTQSVVENFEFPLEANVFVEVKSSVPDQSVIDPNLVQTQYGFVDISQYFIISNTGFSRTAKEAVTAEILVPAHYNLNSSDSDWTQIIWIANPSISTNTIDDDVSCTADSDEFFTYTSASQEQNLSSLSTNQNGTGENETTLSMPPEIVSTIKLGDKYITFSGCDTKRELLNEMSCQKITCKMDLQSRANVPQEIRLHMFISGIALNGLIDKETKGIRVESKITVFYQGRQVTQYVGVAQKSFLRLEGISVLILLGAGGGGIVLLIILTVFLHKCGFFYRKQNEELKRLLKQQIVQEDQEEIIQLALRSRETQQYELTL